jgi:signal peptidase
MNPNNSQNIFLIFLGLLLIVLIKRLAPLLLGVDEPFLVVMSRSMQHTLNPGDLLIVKKCRKEDLKMGDIIAFESKVASRTIVHRIYSIEYIEGERRITTKGDAVVVPDPKIDLEKILGKIVLVLPRIGYPAYLIHRKKA